MSHASWLQDCFVPDRLQHKAKKISHYLSTREDIGSIAVSGMSGAIMGSAVSYITGLPLILIRKGEESTHSGYPVEHYGRKKSNKVAIIDDLISSGATMDRIVKGVRNINLVPKVIILYYSNTKGKEYKRIPIKRIGD